jgi:uncharacterized protein YkuJ
MSKKTQLTQPKLADSQLIKLIERLALIQNHATKFPVSGAQTLDGWLVVAVKIPGHELAVDGSTWTVDGIDITQMKG